MLRNVMWGLLLLVLVGCSNDHLDRMKATPAETVTWDALTELQSGDDGLMSAGQAVAEEDWGRARAYLKGAGFEQAIKKFEQASLPSEWADRAEAKNKVVTQLKSLAEAAKAGAGQDKLKGDWDALHKLFAELCVGPAKQAE